MNSTSFSTDFFEAAYSQTPGWEIGRPQPDLRAVLEEIPPLSPILEVGCGTGALAISLAEAGHRVLGLDLAPTAIARAEAAIPVAVASRLRFRVGNALRPNDLPEAPFGTIVDAGFFHLFDSETRHLFTQQVHAALLPGGRYYLLGFGIQGNYPNAPRQVTIDEILARFAPERGWSVRLARSAGFVTSVLAEPVPAVVACIERR